jgi:Fe-S-cluster containining protein
MITRLHAPGHDRIFDGEVGRFVESSAIPCHRCGVCCERWQPLVTPEEVARLAIYLDVPVHEFYEAYTERYPFDDTARFLRRTDGACVFLQRDVEGRSSCAVHAARPDVCRTWTASLDRRECVDGLSRFGSTDDIVLIPVVYPDTAERARFATVVRGNDG